MIFEGGKRDCFALTRKRRPPTTPAVSRGLTIARCIVAAVCAFTAVQDAIKVGIGDSIGGDTGADGQVAGGGVGPVVQALCATHRITGASACGIAGLKHRLDAILGQDRRTFEDQGHFVRAYVPMVMGCA